MRIRIGNQICWDSYKEPDVPISIEFSEQDILNILEEYEENPTIRDYSIYSQFVLDNNTPADITLWMEGSGDLTY